jgi:hypothetical protein
MIVFVVVGVISTAAYTFFNTSVSQYLSLQKDSLTFGDLATQSQRISNVVRGATDITLAENNELIVYAYFAPNDTYVSLLRYYKSVDGNTLLADLTPMTANPPVGTPITASKRTITILPNFKTVTGVNLFTYLDSVGSVIGTPISELHTIKGIRITLSVPSGPSGTANGNTTISSQVSLRNRKTNL